MCPAGVLAGKRRTVGGPFAGGQRVLLVVAHPDDEIVFAPLLGSLCVEGTSRCTFVVVTRGEQGVCGLPGGCSPDLGTVREREMQAAATLFRAVLVQWAYPDVMQDVRSAWGGDELVGRIRTLIEAVDPTRILTFDPGHGTSCHPAHREIARMTIEAAAPRQVFMLETFVRGTFEFVSARPGVAFLIDATPAWDYLIRDVEAHPSQFTPAQVELLRAVPSKRMYFATSEIAAKPLPECGGE